METLEDQHERMYPTAKEDLHLKEKAKRKQKQTNKKRAGLSEKKIAKEFFL